MTARNLIVIVLDDDGIDYVGCNGDSVVLVADFRGGILPEGGKDVYDMEGDRVSLRRMPDENVETVRLDYYQQLRREAEEVGLL